MSRSALNNIFLIESSNTGIIVIPEPSTLLLLGLGAVMLRKR
ncbi:MAG: PEP-CTERM sorting domain-containing protein [Planctomycetota bacterium]